MGVKYICVCTPVRVYLQLSVTSIEYSLAHSMRTVKYKAQLSLVYNIYILIL
jgi:hypothetical protein